MARTSATLTQAEIAAFQNFCIEHRIIADGEAGHANGNLIGEYIAVTWGEDITPATLSVALEKLRDRLTFYTVAQATYKKIAEQEPDRANRLAVWIASPSNTSLLRDGSDKDLANQTALLSDLRGRDITSSTINAAIGRCSARDGLHFAPTERKADPRQHKPSDEPFMPKTTDRSVVGGRKNYAFTEPKTANPAAPKSTDTWQQMAEQLLHNGTHSQQAAMKEIYDSAINQGRSYREIYSQMKSLKSQYEKLFSPRGV